MRTSSRLLFVFGLAVLGSGCNCLGREITLSHTFNVSAPATDPLCSTKRDSVNLNDDSSFADVKQFVGKVELRKLSVTVTNPKTDPSSVATKAHGSVRVADAANTTALTLGTYADVPITLGSTQDIPFDATAAQKLADLALNAPNTFFFESEGCNDQNPAFYEFRADLTVYVGAF